MDPETGAGQASARCSAMRTSIWAATWAGKGGGATRSQVRMSVHALDERGEHAPGPVYHEHHIMEKLQAPREDAGPDHHGVPDTHFGGIPEVMLEIEAARTRNAAK